MGRREPRRPQLYLVSRNGAQGYTVAPRLAGQRPQYIMSQIRSFREHARDNPFSKQYMWSAVAALEPHTARDLADYFATIAPKAANDGDSVLASQGKNDLPGRNPGSQYRLLLCLSWPKRRGRARYSSPGRTGLFLCQGRLEQWGQGYHSAAGSPMPMVASHLGPDEIEALASYLSFVK